MRRMHYILEENGSVKSIDGLPVGLEVKSYNGSTNSFSFTPEAGKSYLVIGIGNTSEDTSTYTSDVLFIWSYSTTESYYSKSEAMYVHAGEATVYTNFYESAYCVVIPLPSSPTD